MNAINALMMFAVICLTVLTSACNQYDPYNPDTANLVGVWSIDNTVSRRGDEKPVWKRLTIYPTHMEFCPGQGTVGTQGQWKEGEFWCKAKDGSGDIEAAKAISPEEVELHLAAFYPGNEEVLTLYKLEGSEEEKQNLQRSMTAKYPPPLSWPPPQGIITEGMTEYELRNLPWHADRIMGSEGDDRSDDATIYCYHSDNHSLAELRVTVKNHKIISVNGGNG
jgi:hypothetical protein